MSCLPFARYGRWLMVLTLPIAVAACESDNNATPFEPAPGIDITPTATPLPGGSPTPTATPVQLDPLPKADQVERRSPLLPSADTLRYGTVPLVGATLAAILVALGVTAAARRIRSERAHRTPSR